MLIKEWFKKISKYNQKDSGQQSPNDNVATSGYGSVVLDINSYNDSEESAQPVYLKDYELSSIISKVTMAHAFRPTTLYHPEDEVELQREQIVSSFLNKDLHDIVYTLRSSRRLLEILVDSRSIEEVLSKCGLEPTEDWSTEREFDNLIRTFLSGELRIPR